MTTTARRARALLYRWLRIARILSAPVLTSTRTHYGILMIRKRNRAKCVSRVPTTHRRRSVQPRENGTIKTRSSPSVATVDAVSSISALQPLPSSTVLSCVREYDSAYRSEIRVVVDAFSQRGIVECIPTCRYIDTSPNPKINLPLVPASLGSRRIPRERSRIRDQLRAWSVSAYR